MIRTTVLLCASTALDGITAIRKDVFCTYCRSGGSSSVVSVSPYDYCADGLQSRVDSQTCIV